MSFIRVVDAKNTKELPFIEMLFIMFSLFYYILPSFDKINFVLIFCVYLIYLVYVIQRMPIKYAKYAFTILVLSLIISACYFIFTSTSTIDASVSFYHLKRILSKFSQVFFNFFPLVLFVRIVYRGSYKQKRFICCAIAILLLFVVIQTRQELKLYADATRDWAYTEKENENAGGYAFVYAISAIVPTLLIGFHYAKDKWKILTAIIIFLTFGFLLSAQYTLAIMLAIISLLTHVFVSSTNNKIKIIVAVCLPLVYILLPFVLYAIANKVESYSVSLRVTEVADFLSFGERGYNLGSRMELYNKTIIAFFKSPIYGNRYLGFDGHATLLTILSDVGLLGGIPYYYLFFSARNRIKEVLGKTDYKVYFPVFLSFILMGLTNPIHSARPLYIVVWLLAPLLVVLFKEKEEKKKEVDKSGKMEN
ncbi:MAG: hypothetical protein IKK77_03820 [Clostridia bacterium]|nr:hypothetical protein [Clostridia bacterium]